MQAQHNDEWIQPVDEETEIFFTEEEQDQMLGWLEKFEWPHQSRRAVQGEGSCIGATCDGQGPRHAEEKRIA